MHSYQLPPPRPPGLVTRVVAALVAATLIGISIVLGMMALGIILIVGVVAWIWLRWRLRHVTRTDTMEGDFRVVREQREHDPR